MDLTATLFGIIIVLGSMVLSKQVGGVLLMLGVLRFLTNGNRGHNLMFIGLLIFIIGVDLTANDAGSADIEQPEKSLNLWSGYFNIVEPEALNFRLRTFPPMFAPNFG